MNSQPLQAALAMLPELAPDELRRLGTACQSMLEAQGVAPVPRVEDGTRVWDGIVRILAKDGVRLPPSGSRVAKMVGVKGAEDAVIDYVCEHMDPQNKTEQLAAVALVARTVYSYMNKIGVPVSPRTLVQQLRNVGAIMDDAFPGYARNGMMGVLLGHRWGS